MEALCKAAERKVSVYVLADGYASQGLPSTLTDRMKEAGVHFRFFEPLFKSKNLYFGRRMHHKIMVAESEVALVGGINLADRYNDIDETSAWLDFAALVRGPAANVLEKHCKRMWEDKELTRNLYPNDPMTFHPEPEHPVIRVLRNDWIHRQNEISAAYTRMFISAKSHITIFCSYFLPGKVIRRQLHYAARRGVRIQVVITERSDILLAKYAERWFYDWLLRRGVELYEYHPSILHAKLATCDDVWTTVGSYNLNELSWYASIECNLEIIDQAFAKQTTQMLQQIIEKDCIPITKAVHEGQKNWFRQFFRWLSYMLIRLTFLLSTSYYKRDKKVRLPRKELRR
jgi:cardiolipin synthase